MEWESQMLLQYNQEMRLIPMKIKELYWEEFLIVKVLMNSI